MDLKSALIKEERENSTIVVKLLEQERQAREISISAIARAEAAEAALARVPGEILDAVTLARQETSNELKAVERQLQQAQNSVQRLEEWQIDRDAILEKNVALEEELARQKEDYIQKEVILQRRNAADRESMRALLLEHVKDMKRGLLEKTANSMSDNIKRMVSEHEQLLNELAFSSKFGEDLITINTRLKDVRKHPPP